jgi:tetratricopeptide (TPR) repeat protein
MRCLAVLAACACCSLLFVSCGGDNGGPSETASSLTEAGWSRFGDGEYEEAIEKFSRALELDPTYADAHNGLGWSNAKLDLLTKALANFGACIKQNNALVDPYAGGAAVYRDSLPSVVAFAPETAHFDSAIAFADTALSRDPDYVFTRDESFDWYDLHLIKAQSYYGLGEFLLAKAEVDILDPLNTLNPEDPTFVQDLAAKIEELEQEQE